MLHPRRSSIGEALVAAGYLRSVGRSGDGPKNNDPVVFAAERGSTHNADRQQRRDVRLITVGPFMSAWNRSSRHPKASPSRPLRYLDCSGTVRSLHQTRSGSVLRIGRSTRVVTTSLLRVLDSGESEYNGSHEGCCSPS